MDVRKKKRNNEKTTKNKGKKEHSMHEARGAYCSKAYHYMYSCELVKFCPTIMAKQQ